MACLCDSDLCNAKDTGGGMINYTFIDAYMHRCMHAYVHTCICAYMHTCIHAYVHTCICAYMHMCIRAYMHTCIRAHVHTCTCAHMHTCIHAYILKFQGFQISTYFSVVSEVVVTSFMIFHYRETCKIYLESVKPPGGINW
jgi:hypothetical protein